jgi:hypothetical protein
MKKKSLLLSFWIFSFALGKWQRRRDQNYPRRGDCFPCRAGKEGVRERTPGGRRTRPSTNFKEPIFDSRKYRRGGRHSTYRKSCTNAEKNTLDVYGVTLRVRTSGSKTKQTIRTS